MPEQKQYFHILSAIRGIAAILVVLRHTMAFWTFRFPMSFMAVDIFFLLSGVVLEASYRNRLLADLTPWHFIWIRLCRIYPLYMLGTIITVFVLVLAPHHQVLNGADAYPISHKLVSFILTCFMLPNLIRSEVAEFPFDHPTWSLFFELSVNVLYAFIAINLTAKRAILITLACGIGLLGSLFFYHHVELGWMRKTIPGGVFRTGFSFFLGVLLYRAKVTYGANLEFLRRNSGVLQWIVFASTLFLLAAPVPEHLRRVVYIASVYAFFPLIIFMALSWSLKKQENYGIFLATRHTRFIRCRFRFIFYFVPLSSRLSAFLSGPCLPGSVMYFWPV